MNDLKDQEKEEKIVTKFDPLGMVKRDRPYIIVIILVLGACMYTMYQANHVTDLCNDHYLKEFERLECVSVPSTNVSDDEIRLFQNLKQPQTTINNGDSS